MIVSGIPSLSITAAAQPTPTPAPAATTIDQRVEKLEEDIQDLREAAEKDVWDKLQASGPLIGGFLAAVIGAFATVLYNSRQQRAAERQAAQELTVNRVKTMGELMPFLSSENPRQVEAALVSISELGDPELATNMSVIYKHEGGVGALGRLASGPDEAVAETARATLESVFAGLHESAAVIRIHGRDVGMAVFVDTKKLVTPNFIIQEAAAQTMLPTSLPMLECRRPSNGPPKNGR